MKFKLLGLVAVAASATTLSAVLVGGATGATQSHKTTPTHSSRSLTSLCDWGFYEFSGWPHVGFRAVAKAHIKCNYARVFRQSLTVNLYEEEHDKPGWTYVGTSGWAHSPPGEWLDRQAAQHCHWGNQERWWKATAFADANMSNGTVSKGKKSVQKLLWCVY